MAGIQVDFKAEYKSYKPEREKEIADKIQQGLQKAVLVVERQAKEDCPVDTGRLRSSITSEVKGDEGKVGTNVEYARRQEFGFSGADSRGRIFNQVPRPYLRPALDEKKQSVAKEIAAALKILLGKL